MTIACISAFIACFSTNNAPKSKIFKFLRSTLLKCFIDMQISEQLSRAKLHIVRRTRRIRSNRIFAKCRSPNQTNAPGSHPPPAFPNRSDPHPLSQARSGEFHLAITHYTRTLEPRRRHKCNASSRARDQPLRVLTNPSHGIRNALPFSPPNVILHWFRRALRCAPPRRDAQFPQTCSQCNFRRLNYEETIYPCASPIRSSYHALTALGASQTRHGENHIRTRR